MERDIFASYLNNLNSPLSEAADHSAKEVVSSHLLMEIHEKLDSMKGDCKTISPDAYDLAVVNGRVVLPDEGVFACDIYVKDGKIAALGKNGQANQIVDAGGRYVCPGIIDPHVHLGLFAALDEEIGSETKSALLGGITTIGCHIGSKGTHFDTYPDFHEKVACSSYTDVIPHLIIANTEQLREIPEYVGHLGITSFKVYMNGIPGMIPDVDDGFIMDVFGEVKKTGRKCIVCAHAENRDLVRRANRLARERYGPEASIESWDATHPDMAEEEAVIRLSYLAGKSGVPVYFVHITSKLAAERLRQIKFENRYVIAETTSPYLAIDKEQICGNRFKMEPPFREREDREALWKALEIGVLDTIGTDNVTMTSQEKKMDQKMWDAMPGYPALETHLAAVLDEGLAKRGLPIEELIGSMTKRPAQAFGVYPRKGTLLPGSDADITIVDMNLEREVRSDELHSRSDFSLFEGRRLKGWPVTTIKGGVVMVEEGKLTSEFRNGKVLER